MKLGFQLSSLTPYLRTAEDLRKTCWKIAEMGYTDIQLQGVPIYLPDQEIALALKDAGLRCVATQEDFPLGFGDDPQRYIQRAAICGSQYLTCALIPQEADSPAKLARFAERLAEIGEQAKRAGLIFAFHPIGSDYRLMDGIPVYQRLMGLLPQEVQLTFCVYATFGSGIDYRQVLRDYAGRVDLAHFKDSLPKPGGKDQLMPLGEGSHDWQPIAAACEAAGVKWVFAEQERWDRDAFDCAASSFRYLRGVLDGIDR